jgi:Kef-type K+ transport system membrane component KefB
MILRLVHVALILAIALLFGPRSKRLARNRFLAASISVALATGVHIVLAFVLFGIAGLGGTGSQNVPKLLGMLVGNMILNSLLIAVPIRLLWEGVKRSNKDEAVEELFE